ncbi:MAG: GNAT family N-acetyltransferase [Armatimonadota bacterium]
MVDRLREHDITIIGKSIVLRPMTEDDWDILVRWNCDPEVMYFSDGNDKTSYSLNDVQNIYRSVSQNALCFVVEYAGNPIGECWLQMMNLPRIIESFPGLDLRRIDIMIGEKDFWGKGTGTESIGLLTKYGFEEENSDIIFGCDIWDYNIRSRCAFEKNGYILYQEVPIKEGSRAKVCWDMFITKERYLNMR